jgi:hypothetical protein
MVIQDVEEIMAAAAADLEVLMVELLTHQHQMPEEAQ